MPVPQLNVSMSFNNINLELERLKFEETISAEIVLRSDKYIPDNQLDKFFEKDPNNHIDYKVPEISHMWLGWCKRAMVNY
jgi:hypothetical protein